jgi:DNA-binding transcriptional LysR family regulator
VLPFSRFARYFLEVSHQGSLRKAADVLHVSASSIDRQILRAEEELETRLFERLPTGLKLTSAGELLLDDIRRWGKDYRRTLQRIDDLKGLKRGHVGIAVIDALSEGFVARMLAEMGEEHPLFTFDVRVLENSAVGEAVVTSEVDCGVLLDPIESPSLKIRARADIPIGMAMPPDHPLARESSLSVSRALVGYRQIVAAAPLIVHERAKRLYAPYQSNSDQVVSCNDVRMMRSLIRGGAGIGLLSLIDVAMDVDEGRLAFVRLHGRQTKPLTLALCVAPHRQLSQAAQLVIERLVAALTSIA